MASYWDDYGMFLDVLEMFMGFPWDVLGMITGCSLDVF